LASNSLLEGLVFGALAGSTAAARAAGLSQRPPSGRMHSDNPVSERTALDLQDIHNSLRSVMWRNAGIERTGNRLAETREIIDFWGHYVLDKTFDDTRGWETQNMLTLSRLIVTAAHERKHSIGVHCRTDAGGTDQSQPLHHLVVERSPDGPKISRFTLDFAPAS
jgi:L-aspartate oxidase